MAAEPAVHTVRIVYAVPGDLTRLSALVTVGALTKADTVTVGHQVEDEVHATFEQRIYLRLQQSRRGTRHRHDRVFHGCRFQVGKCGSG